VHAALRGLPEQLFPPLVGYTTPLRSLTTWLPNERADGTQFLKFTRLPDKHQSLPPPPPEDSSDLSYLMDPEHPATVSGESDLDNLLLSGILPA
jgi:hypothetical protein